MNQKITIVSYRQKCLNVLSNLRIFHYYRSHVILESRAEHSKELISVTFIPIKPCVVLSRYGLLLNQRFDKIISRCYLFGKALNLAGQLDLEITRGAK